MICLAATWKAPFTGFNFIWPYLELLSGKTQGFVENDQQQLFNFTCVLGPDTSWRKTLTLDVKIKLWRKKCSLGGFKKLCYISGDLIVLPRKDLRRPWSFNFGPPWCFGETGSENKAVLKNQNIDDITQHTHTWPFNKRKDIDSKHLNKSLSNYYLNNNWAVTLVTVHKDTDFIWFIQEGH